jgi:hypothetical protein
MEALAGVDAAAAEIEIETTRRPFPPPLTPTPANKGLLLLLSLGEAVKEDKGAACKEEDGVTRVVIPLASIGTDHNNKQTTNENESLAPTLKKRSLFCKELQYEKEGDECLWG